MQIKATIVYTPNKPNKRVIETYLERKIARESRLVYECVGKQKVENLLLR